LTHNTTPLDADGLRCGFAQSVILIAASPAATDLTVVMVVIKR
jgi:hypothetical protein